MSTLHGSAVSCELLGTDVEFSPLTYSVVTPPANGILSGTGSTMVYTPDAALCGNDSFTFRANDGVADSNVATVNINVAPRIAANGYFLNIPE